MDDISQISERSSSGRSQFSEYPTDGRSATLPDMKRKRPKDEKKTRKRKRPRILIIKERAEAAKKRAGDLANLDIAKKIGVHHGTVGRWFDGSSEVPMAAWPMIENLLDVSMEFLTQEAPTQDEQRRVLRRVGEVFGRPCERALATLATLSGDDRAVEVGRLLARIDQRPDHPDIDPHRPPGPSD